MDTILAKHTAMPVHQVRETTVVEPNCVYLIPPEHNIVYVSGRIELKPRAERPTPNRPVDLCFESLAANLGHRCIGILLSGTGSDGTRGASAIKQSGGLVMAEDPRTAKFGDMPRNAVQTGWIDLVAESSELAHWVSEFLEISAQAENVSTDVGENEDLSNDPAGRLIDLLRQRKETDFSGYNRTMFYHRLRRRMLLSNRSSLDRYIELVEQDFGELDALYNELLIYVTCFRRDPVAFEILRREVIQPLVENHAADGAIRIWVPGCATGEEAITLAILTEEVMAELGKVVPYKIFATDVSQGAIQKAALTTFLPEQMHGLAPEEIEKYFIPVETGFRLKKLMRDRMLFAPLDLTTDPPLTRMNLVSCRNVLVYLNREVQKRVLALLHFALKEGGHLFLGSTESVDMLNTSSFEVVSVGARIYRRGAGQGRLSTALGGGGGPDRRPTTSSRPEPEAARAPKRPPSLGLVDALVGEFGTAALLVDRAFQLQHVFGEGGKYLTLGRGAFSMDVTKLVHDGLRVPFVAALQRTVRDRCDTICLGTSLPTAPDASLSIKFKYIAERETEEYVLILFEEKAHRTVTLPASDGEGGETLVFRLNELEEELAKTKVSLQVSVEDLESANEELQSTNEELMASNEELQSTNEELQSVNEELHTVNSEYQEKITELTEVTGDLENYLESTEAGTIFLDRQLRIRSFTPAVRVAIPLMRHDVGRPIGDLQHSLADISLVDLCQDVLLNKTSLSRETTNTRGNWIQVRLTPYWNRNRDVDGVVVTLIDVTEVKDAEFRLRALLEANPDVMFRVSASGELLDVKLDAMQREDLRLPMEDLRLQSIHDLPFPVSARSRLEAAVRSVIEGGTGEKLSLEFRLGSDYDPRHLQATITRSGTSEAVILIRNVTESKLITEELARQALYDPLTGILNRRGLEQLLLVSLERCRRDGSRLGAILLDIDNFKQINDKLGHSVGDAVLKGVAQKLRACLRPTDLPARIGGDEFLVILSDSRESDAHQLAERLRIAVTEVPLILTMQAERPTASFGLAMVDPETSSLEQVITATQRFLSLSKKHGKNRVIGMANSTEMAPEDDILSTLTSGIHSLVQPIRRLDNRHIVAYEVLSRGPEGQYSSPVVLFRISLEQNALTTVDLHCLKRGLHRVASELPEKSIFVNVFPSTLLDTPVKKIEELFRDLDDPSRFCVELSEQQFVGDPRCLLEHVAVLRGLGVRLAIDDVGFGRSSLESILLLQPDIMKLDRSLVHGISVRRGSRELLGRAMRIADSLNLEVVAEGIEDTADLDILLSLGIPYGQGYLLGGPGRPEDVRSSASLLSAAAMSSF